MYQKYSSIPIRTFTIGFDEEAYNEAGYARAVAQALGTEHHEQIVTPEQAREVIPQLPSIYDEPFADSSQIPTYLVSRFARQQVTVSLSGDGGDELFGGYNRYIGTARLWSRLKLAPAPVRSAAAAALGRLPAQTWDRLARLARQRQLPPHFGVKVRKSLRTVAGARDLDQVLSAFLDEWAGEQSPVIGGGVRTSGLCPFDLDVGPGAPDALRMMYCDATSYLPDDILCKVDRASMAVSLEAHAPYLDHRVAAVAARIPIGMNIRGGTGKYMLRQLLYREAPQELFERPKSGFAIPVGDWIKGPLRDWAEDLLEPVAMRAAGWLDPQPIQRRWREHLAGVRDSTPAIWAILMFQAWLIAQEASVSAAA
jgi:asparagine synthase (glutamine-hydrolysing)